MSFEAWYKKNSTATIRAMPWIKEELKEAWNAGQKELRLRVIERDRRIRESRK